MPFKSEAQRRFMWKFHPKIAREWSDKYGSGKGLPYHKTKSVGTRRQRRLRKRSYVT